MSLSPMLTPKGKLYGDLTIACLAEDHFMLFGSGSMQEAHRRWFEQYLPESGVSYTNMSDAYHGIGIAGPNSRELLQRICRDDVSGEGMKFLDIRQTFVAGVPVILARISFSGELGYEIYTAPQYQIRLAEAIEEAGENLGLRWYGARALMSMRLEKGWGAWTLDFRPDFTAVESGLDFFINWGKEFVGKEFSMQQRKDGSKTKLVTLVIETDSIDVSNDEAIMHNGEAVGYVSSGGFAHYVGKSMALGYVPVALAAGGQELEVEILGAMYKAEVQAQPLYDPKGEKMRS
jgi:dimethylglycine dehydrogenase